MKYMLAFYEKSLEYGGPEEGGWWYDSLELVRPARRIFNTEKAANEACSRANRLLSHLQRRKLPVSSMAYSGGRHAVEVFSGEAPKYLPNQRPYYE